jgi:hypothetical protein
LQSFSQNFLKLRLLIRQGSELIWKFSRTERDEQGIKAFSRNQAPGSLVGSLVFGFRPAPLETPSTSQIR